MIAYFDDCADCCGPVRLKTRFEIVRDALAYDLWLVLPLWLACSKAGYAVLSWAGGHAYTCTCPNKVLP